VVVIAVDRTSIRAGGELALLLTASALIDTLSPGDDAGAIGLPADAIEPTRDHSLRTAEERNVTGSAPTGPRRSRP
jgi:hypothetical protein